MPRRPLGDRAMTAAERKQRQRQKQKSPPKPILERIQNAYAEARELGLSITLIRHRPAKSFRDTRQAPRRKRTQTRQADDSA
jgi:hypothetical protein